MSQFAAAFGGIKEARNQPQPTADPDKASRTPQSVPRTTKPPKGAQGLAKSRNPDYEPVKLFMNTAKRRKAERKWEDEGGRDLSSLIEALLTKYIGT